MESRDGKPRQCDEAEEYGSAPDIADAADTKRAEGDDGKKQTIQVVLVHEETEDRLQEIGSDGKHHDQKPAHRQGKPEPGHDDRQEHGQEIAVKIVEEMACTEQEYRQAAVCTRHAKDSFPSLFDEVRVSPL